MLHSGAGHDQKPETYLILLIRTILKERCRAAPGRRPARRVVGVGWGLSPLCGGGGCGDAASNVPLVGAKGRRGFPTAWSFRATGVFTSDRSFFRTPGFSERPEFLRATGVFFEGPEFPKDRSFRATGVSEKPEFPRNRSFRGTVVSERPEFPSDRSFRATGVFSERPKFPSDRSFYEQPEFFPSARRFRATGVFTSDRSFF